MSNNVRFSSTIPPAEPRMNGLDAIAQEIVADPMVPRVLLVVVDCPTTRHDNETDQDVPLVRIRRIEPLGTVGDVEKEVPELHRLYKSAFSRRLDGQEPLPLDTVEITTGGALKDDE